MTELPPPAPPRRSALDPPEVAVALFAVLLALSFTVFDGGTHRSFFVPKLLATYATAVAALGVLLVRCELRWPSLRVAAWTGAAFAAMALLALNAAAPEQAWVELSVLACGVVVFFCAAQLSERERRLLSWAVVAAAALQLAVALLQAFDLRALLPAALHSRLDKAAFGSVGKETGKETEERRRGHAAETGRRGETGSRPSTFHMARGELLHPVEPSRTRNAANAALQR